MAVEHATVSPQAAPVLSPLTLARTKVRWEDGQKEGGGTDQRIQEKVRMRSGKSGGRMGRKGEKDRSMNPRANERGNRG